MATYTIGQIVAVTLVDFLQNKKQSGDPIPDEDVMVKIEVRKNTKGRGSLIAEQITLFADTTKQEDRS